MVSSQNVLARDTLEARECRREGPGETAVRCAAPVRRYLMFHLATQPTSRD
jgi:hypothetical protein